LSTPNHISDYQQVRNKLRAEGIECSENASSLGTLSCSIPEGNFQRAKEVLAELIPSNSLTVRVKKENDSDLFEIYEHGKKVTEERYIPGDAPNTSLHASRISDLLIESVRLSQLRAAA